MNKLSFGCPNQPPTIASLKSECHALIEVVSRRPGAIKLLVGVRNQLIMFSQYEANRDNRFR